MVSDEDINKLKKQVEVSEIEAKRLLIKHNNNIVNCVLDSYGIYKEELSKPSITKPSITKLSITKPSINNLNQINSKNIVVI